ncbi:MAG: rhodanese-like domain-containing protein [Mastigocoleus sp.]
MNSKSPQLLPQSSAQDLKARLDWGEPGFTILDVRDRMTYNKSHIIGAMPMDMSNVAELAEASLDRKRDIYVYGQSDQETAQAATKLRVGGFGNVVELLGGLEGWKEIGGACEGTE